MALPSTTPVPPAALDKTSIWAARIISSVAGDKNVISAIVTVL